MDVAVRVMGERASVPQAPAQKPAP